MHQVVLDSIRFYAFTLSLYQSYNLLLCIEKFPDCTKHAETYLTIDHTRLLFMILTKKVSLFDLIVLILCWYYVWIAIMVVDILILHISTCSRRFTMLKRMY